MPTEQEIREWVRSENEKLEFEKQAACDHLRSGSLKSNGEVTCNYCGKTMVKEDYGRYLIE